MKATIELIDGSKAEEVSCNCAETASGFYMWDKNAATRAEAKWWQFIPWNATKVLTVERE